MQIVKNTTILFDPKVRLMASIDTFDSNQKFV